MPVEIYDTLNMPVDIERSFFPNGELYVQLSNVPEVATFVVDGSDASTLVELGLLVDAVRRVHSSASLHLLYPLFPYSRQDRVCSPGEPLGLAWAAKYINGMGFKSVKVVEPHSSVTTALLDNVKIIDMVVFADSVKKRIPEKIFIVAPDAGAEKRAATFAKHLGVEMICCSKTRDSRTGEVTGLRVNANQLPEGDALIVDDICDGGRTFIEVSKALNVIRTIPVHLFVAHGLFTKGFQPLHQHLQKLFWMKLDANKLQLRMKDLGHAY